MARAWARKAQVLRASTALASPLASRPSCVPAMSAGLARRASAAASAQSPSSARRTDCRGGYASKMISGSEGQQKGAPVGDCDLIQSPLAVAVERATDARPWSWADAPPTGRRTARLKNRYEDTSLQMCAASDDARLAVGAACDLNRFKRLKNFDCWCERSEPLQLGSYAAASSTFCEPPRNRAHSAMSGRRSSRKSVRR